jgi:hypothetical protein
VPPLYPNSVDRRNACSPRSRSALADSDLGMLPAELICRTFQLLDVYSLCQLSLVPPPPSSSPSRSRPPLSLSFVLGQSVRMCGVRLCAHRFGCPDQVCRYLRTIADGLPWKQYYAAHIGTHSCTITTTTQRYRFVCVLPTLRGRLPHRTPVASVVATTTHSARQKEPVEESPGGRKAIRVPVRACIPWRRYNDNRGSSGWTLTIDRTFHRWANGGTTYTLIGHQLPVTLLQFDGKYIVLLLIIILILIFFHFYSVPYLTHLHE